MARTIKFNSILLTAFTLFLLSCEAKELIVNPIGSDNFVREVFLLNEENSISIQDSVNIGDSQRLYSGIINGDTTYLFLQINIDHFSLNHPVCDSVISYGLPSISLKSFSNILQFENEDSYEYYINEDNLKIYLSDFSVLGNEWDEDINLLSNQIEIEKGDELSFYAVDNNIIKIEFPEFDNNGQDSYIDLWCSGNKIGLIIQYLPDELHDIRFIEWYSSESNNKPKVNIDYISLDLTSKQSNQFIINSVLSDYGFHYIDNDSSLWSPSWGHFYIMDLDTNSILEEVVNLSHFPIIADLSVPVSSNENLIQINLSLNSDIIDSIDVINFSLSNAKAYLFNDPQNDNVEVGGSENNNVWDHEDINQDGIIDTLEVYELWDDFGLDQCQDIYENGFGGCCKDKLESDCMDSDGCLYSDSGVCISSVYNSTGLVGNGKWDYIDEDGDGLFDVDIDSYEFWIDSGIGQEINLDPSYDDFNPSLGNDNPQLFTEGNGIYDYPGEICLDFGLDGLPDTGDIHEGDNVCDDFELFFDTGIDGLFSVDEDGYCDCQINNNQWDFIDANENGLYDLGEQHESWIDEGIGEEYNVDPNNDNFDPASADNNDPDIYTENNFIYDAIDEFNYEFWYDFGIDQVSDSLEHVIDSNIVLIALGDNEYSIDINNFSAYSQPMAPLNVINDIFLWVSNISKLNDEYIIDVSIWTEKNLKGIEFSLDIDPIIWSNEFEVFHSTSFSEINQFKLFEDISVYTIDVLDTNMVGYQDRLRVNYAYGIDAKFNFSGLDSFILSNQNTLISSDFTQLVCPIDVEISQIDSSGAKLIIEDDKGAFENATVEVGDSTIVIPMGQILQFYSVGDYPNSFDFKLLLHSSKNNFSDLYLIKDGSYLEVFNTK